MPERASRDRTSGACILVVEDDATLSSGLRFTLEREGYRVATAATRAAAEALLPGRFDLILLDVGLPDGSGFELCRCLRRVSRAPVIFLTARDEEVSVVRGLDEGGDDYVTKPFRVRELLSRIAACLRRAGAPEDAGRLLRSGDVSADLSASRAFRGGVELRLTPGELRLLVLFLENPGRTLTREAIMDRMLHVDGAFVDGNTLSVYVRRLREKLEADPSAPSRIATVRGIGYRWEG